MTLYMCFNIIDRMNSYSGTINVFMKGKAYMITIKRGKFYLIDEDGKRVKIYHYYTDCKSLVVIFENRVPKWFTCDELTSSDTSTTES